MTSQHSHKTTPFTRRKFSIILISDGVQSPANIGGLFRTCEAFGVSEIVFGDASFDINSARIQKTARNTHLKVPYSQVDDVSIIIKNLKEQGYKIIALEVTRSSIPIHELSMDVSDKIALIVGNEQQGISEMILGMSTQAAHIEMFGSNSSMNVNQATGIALFSLTKSKANE